MSSGSSSKGGVCIKNIVFVVVLCMISSLAYFGSLTAPYYYYYYYYYYWTKEEGGSEKAGNGGDQPEAAAKGCEVVGPPLPAAAAVEECNWFKGKWVWDERYPMYDSLSCPFIRNTFHCLKFGRPNRQYLKYRWQPYNCDLPRFDGEEFLRRMKGKKIMYVGDSLSLNNFQSLLCLLHNATPAMKYKEKDTPLNITVTFQDYDVQVILFHSNFLVDIEEEQIGRVVKMNSLKNGEIWKQMDVLIFNSWLWWTRTGPKQPWDYIEKLDGQIVKDMNRLGAFEMVLQSWARWVDREIDPNKTKVFYQGESSSPYHYRGNYWGKSADKNCQGEFTPLNETTIFTTPSECTNITKRIMGEMSKPAYLLDIETLSRFRVDGHVSGYNGYNGTDCAHWCLAGVPDTWNTILSAALLQKNIGFGTQK